MNVDLFGKHLVDKAGIKPLLVRLYTPLTVRPRHSSPFQSLPYYFSSPNQDGQFLRSLGEIHPLWLVDSSEVDVNVCRLIVPEPLTATMRFTTAVMTIMAVATLAAAAPAPAPVSVQRRENCSERVT